LATFEPDRLQHAIEQLSGPADKRAPDAVLVPARRLANEHHPRAGPAVCEYELCRRSLQAAFLKGLQTRPQGREVGRGCGEFTGGDLGGRPPAIDARAAGGRCDWRFRPRLVGRLRCRRERRPDPIASEVIARRLIDGKFDAGLRPPSQRSSGMIRLQNRVSPAFRSLARRR
jgi:hypothetical protein